MEQKLRLRKSVWSFSDERNTMLKGLKAGRRLTTERRPTWLQRSALEEWERWGWRGGQQPERWALWTWLRHVDSILRPPLSLKDYRWGLTCSKGHWGERARGASVAAGTTYKFWEIHKHAGYRNTQIYSEEEVWIELRTSFAASVWSDCKSCGTKPLTWGALQ